MSERQLPPEGTENDALLVRESLRGSQPAFEALVQRHHRRVFGLALLLVRDPHGAEDVTQDVFLRAYRALKTCTEPERFVAWLAGIARNCAREWLRGRGRSTLPLDALPDQSLDMPVQEPTLDERQDRLAALERAVAALPDDVRQVLVMKYQERRTCAEIAERLQKKTNTVAKTLSRAYEQLERIIGRREPANNELR
jgi:RNA polymerase sigma factor (sigma-70 family)